ncbi:bolA-like protein 2 [Ischnura elegans]|uniref:bolA-like protein 2 n=1 Tax=Ischnura elegans TaxID=197161 RepID=UPI001ED86F61|nr:bolA-like protein 2 [Ischnura elegans]
MSKYSASYLTEKLSKALEATHVDVHDDSDGCGAKFSALIVSPKFEGLPLLQRHRLVNSTLQEELTTIHAFSQKTLTPAQWEEQKSKVAQ